MLTAVFVTVLNIIVVTPAIAPAIAAEGGNTAATSPAIEPVICNKPNQNVFDLKIDFIVLSALTSKHSRDQELCNMLVLKHNMMEGD